MSPALATFPFHGGIMRIVGRIVVCVALVLFAGLGVAYLLVRGSLPQLDGKVAAATRSAVQIERDALGVATIAAGNRVDLAYATGFVHGQDRYFQMDMQRRVAAGELAELLGEALVDMDKRSRRHDFRNVARAVLAQATPEQRELVAAYTAGVNAARGAMRVRPFEYLLLQSPPAPWVDEDCVLVVHAMYLVLNDSHGMLELQRARLNSALPKAVFDLLYPRGSEWDATLDGADLSSASAPLPGPEAVDLRGRTLSQSSTVAGDRQFYGSNNWAVAGSRTKDGGALIANDMHLGLQLPNIWYRARMIVKTDAPDAARDLVGVTLPGSPFLVAGSNGRIAWGFTNAHGDFNDLVLIETDVEHANRYHSGDRYLDYAIRREQIKVRGAAPVEVEFKDTIWGPLLAEQFDGKPIALAWTAHEPAATNFNQLTLESAATVTEALDIATTVGIPVQNFIVADAAGDIGWGPIGRLPKRVGYDGSLPECWGCVLKGWSGWLEASAYPRIVDPEEGQLWTANSRTLGGAGHELIGDEGMDRGARAKQIRDGLLALDQATPQDMLDVQMDDRALFLQRWRDLLLRMRDVDLLSGGETRLAALRLVEAWSGRASADSSGYRIVKAFRSALQEDIFGDLTAAAQAKHPGARFWVPARFEDSLWKVVTLQPPHLLDSKFESWNHKILYSLDRALAQLKADCEVSDKELAECTWGRRNTLKMEHPLTSALPLVGRFLRMPREALSGDDDMPFVQGATVGASERFAVSPGREAEGYFHMPGGQSGHPLSPYFQAGHDAWVKGEQSPFLPGAAQHVLTLSPQ